MTRLKIKDYVTKEDLLSLGFTLHDEYEDAFGRLNAYKKFYIWKPLEGKLVEEGAYILIEHGFVTFPIDGKIKVLPDGVIQTVVDMETAGFLELGEN